MTHNPADLRYTPTHEWVRLDEDGELTIGITEHAQQLLGDIVFVELPEVESEISAGEEIGVIESVKAAADLFCPISGEVTAINTALNDQPDLINDDPYGEGWLFKIESYDQDEVEKLLDAESYAEKIAAEAH